MISRKKEIQEKQQGKTIDGKSSKTSSCSTSRQWSAFRDPRIVRVSRHFGGKDRHSKVCTIRGLRDRRIRLSVPTAFQIYELQFKLGLSQPSKVIDWLLDASKDDIDMLPPLPTIPHGFTQFHGQMNVNAAAFLGHVSQSSLVPFLDVNDGRASGITRSWLPGNENHVKINNNVEEYDHGSMMSRSKYWNVADSSREQQKEAARDHDVKGKWIAAFSDDSQVGSGSFSGQVSSAQNFFPISHSSWPDLLTNGAANMSHNSHSQWEPSNLTLSPFNSTSHNLRYQSSLGVSSSGFQPYLCPSIVAQPLLHNPCYITNPLESNTRQLDHFRLLNSSSQNLPFSLNVNASLMPSQYNNESHPIKDNTNDS